MDPDDEAALIRFGEVMAMDTDQDADFQQDLQQQGFRYRSHGFRPQSV